MCNTVSTQIKTEQVFKHIDSKSLAATDERTPEHYIIQTTTQMHAEKSKQGMTWHIKKEEIELNMEGSAKNQIG